MPRVIPFASYRSPPADPLRLGDGTLSDLFVETPQDAGGVGFVLAALQGAGRPVLWLQDRVSALEAGEIYLLSPRMSGRIALHGALSRPLDVLRAMEEGLDCAALGGVVGEIWGDPPALNFTATKRLALRAEARGMACWLIRRAGAPGLSAARNRWRIASLPSAANPDDPKAPGGARWRAELFRSRLARPGHWVLTHDRAADRLDFAPASGDGALVETRRAGGYATAP